MPLTYTEPSQLPEWDPANPAHITDPVAQKAVGFQINDLFASYTANWFFNRLWLWCRYLQDVVNNSYGVQHDVSTGEHTELVFDAAKGWIEHVGSPANNNAWIYSPSDFSIVFDPTSSDNSCLPGATGSGKRAYYPLGLACPQFPGTNTITLITLTHLLADAGDTIKVSIESYSRSAGTFSSTAVQTITGTTGLLITQSLAFNVSAPSSTTDKWLVVELEATGSIGDCDLKSVSVHHTFDELA